MLSTQELELKHIKQKVENFIQLWGQSDKIETYTSGSTGRRTKINLSKRFMVASAKATIEYFDLQHGENALLCLNIDTIAGKMMIIRSIIGNLNLTPSEPSSRPLQNIDEKIDFVAMVPLQLEASIDHDLEKLRDIRVILVGGAPISAALLEKIICAGIIVHHSYGMTETISHVALKTIPSDNTSYVAMNNVTFTESNSCLVVNAPDIGVFNMKTNDIVDLVSPKEFKWKGRSDFVINSGGIKLHPEEIENLISPIINTPYFVAGLKDDRLGNKLVLCIEDKVQINYERIDFTPILGNNEIPKEIYYFKSFNYTDSNKIDRKTTLTNIDNAIKKSL